MRQIRTKRFALAVAAVALLGAMLLGGCEKDLMQADTTPPSGSYITNPADGEALRSQIINVRGRAEVGATVEVTVSGIDSMWTGVAAPAVPNDGDQGRFTVENVNLGDEGMKTIRAVVTDLYGNTAREPVEIEVELDVTPPPINFEYVIDAELDSLGNWATGLPNVTSVGWTDTTAAGARVRYGINYFYPDTYVTIPGEIDTVRFWVPMNAPPLTGADPESLVQYYMESFDEAGNVSSEPFAVHWIAEGKDTVLTWDDGNYGSIGNEVTGQNGMKLAVWFQAPTWANYVVEIQYYVMNDNVDNPNDPQAPSTKPFIAYVWRPNQDMRPGIPGTDGLNSGELYPEDTWLYLTLPNSVQITNNEWYPDKQFFVGMEWMHRNNPIFGLDDNLPIDYNSFRWNWTEWEQFTAHDAMVRAKVSDIPSAAGRTAVIYPVGHTIKQ